jgi:hypothetical protein
MHEALLILAKILTFFFSIYGEDIREKSPLAIPV